jgi:pectate lyase
MRRIALPIPVLYSLALLLACAGQPHGADEGTDASATGGTSATGGSSATSGSGGAATPTGGNTGGTGGAAGGAGQTASGGATGTGGGASGGTTGSGGASARGGATGAGGAAGVAGAAGAGAAAGAGGAKGGTSGSGGAAGSGGTTGTGGAKGGTTGSGGAAGATGTGGTTSTGGVGGTTTADGCPADPLIGFASVSGQGVTTTTGGGSAAATTVTTCDEFKAAIADTAPRVIMVSGTITGTDCNGGYGFAVASNKTIIGVDKNATIHGGIYMTNVSNVIVRNLNVQGVWPNSGADDTLHSQGSHHIWYDHLNIWDATDGEMDITLASNYHTVSWCKFWYTSASNGHRLCSLNGSGGGDHPEDSGHEKATYHHNWWSTLVNERMPRMMYGQLHAFNNYYTSTGNLYCIGVGSFGSAIVENNYFKDVNNPHQFMYDLHAYIGATGNTYDNTTGLKDTGIGGTQGPSGVNANVEEAGPFTPPYSYTMDKAADVPSIVQKCAGPH